jgi:SAM-dependent methyltransferase
VEHAALEPAYADADLAGLYDALNPWGAADAFYLDRVLRAASVLDVGCGTGALLARAAGSAHPGRLVGADPSPAMLALARAKAPTLTWMQATAATVPLATTVDLLTMTGHVFQVLLDDDAVAAALNRCADRLRPGGRMLLDTRNPDVAPWERWTERRTLRRVRSPHGEVVDVHHELVDVRGLELVRFTTVYRWVASGTTRTSTSTLRFLDADRLVASVERAGLRVEELLGGWDGTSFAAGSPEIVLSATRR